MIIYSKKKVMPTLTAKQCLAAFADLPQAEKGWQYQSEDDARISVALGHPYAPQKNTEDSGLVWLNNFRNASQQDRIKTAVIWDTETTSLTGVMVSIALELVNLETGELIDSYYQVMNPEEKITEEAFKVHKITQKETEKYHTLPAYWERISSFFDDADVMVGQNLGFDIEVLERHTSKYDLMRPNYTPVIDTMPLISKHIGLKTSNNRKKNPNLLELVEYFNITLPEGDFHNAQVDVEMTRKVFLSFLKMDLPDGEDLFA